MTEGASAPRQGSALATFPMCGGTVSLAPNLGLARVAWVTGMACFKGGGVGRWGKTAGASSENIKPSIWRVMAAFEISPYRSILSSRARSVRWGCEGWAGGGVRVKPLSSSRAPVGSAAGTGLPAVPTRSTRAPTSHPFAAPQAYGIGGESQVVIFCLFVSLFFSFFFHLPPSPRASPPPSK